MLGLSRRRLLLGSAASLLPGRPSWSATETPRAINVANGVGNLPNVMTALMKLRKIPEKFGLEINAVGVLDGSKILGGIIGGSVDASMMSGFGQVFPAIEHGADLRILGGAALTPTLALYTGKTEIKSLQDLEGRTIGTGSIGALLYQLTVTLLRKFDVDTSKIRFVNVGSNADVFRAVTAGSVDAGAGESALIEVADRYHVRLIPHGDMSVELPEYTFQGAWTSKRAIDAKRDILVRTLAAHAELYRFVQKPDAKDSFLQAGRSIQMSERDGNLIWDFIQRTKPFAVDLTLSKERLDYLQRLNIDFKAQRQILPFDHIADMSLAQDALKLIGKS